jgi:ribosomal protein S18 acetylase RimI-like enzyme
MGPAIRVAEHSDISRIAELQALVWQDHFLKERNMRVPMMRRSARNLEYYMRKDPGGCLVMQDAGAIVGSIISHVWGAVGWFGPLEVNPVCQGKGHGKALVSESVKYLRSRGCKTIGCETMASSPKNIAFYVKQGFRLRSLSHVLYKRLGNQIEPNMHSIREITASEPLDKYRRAWSQVMPGLDYTAEFASVHEGRLGNVYGIDTDKGTAHAIVHNYEMFDESQNAIVKLLVAAKGEESEAGALLGMCEESAIRAGRTGMFIRAYEPSAPRLGWFFDRGYMLQGTSVRLIMEGADEAGTGIHVSCWSG